jgi:hypothetical protein
VNAGAANRIQGALAAADRAAHKQKMLCIQAVTSVLLHGRPMTSYAQLGELMGLSKHPDHSKNHWTQWSGWQMAEAVDAVVLQRMESLVRESSFFSLSCDESTDNSRVNQLSIHLYAVTAQWERKHLLIRFCPTDLPATAETLESQLLKELKHFTGMDDNAIASRFICIATDGASCLRGCHNGVQVRLQRRYPFLLGFHCMAHRIDLAAKAVKDSRSAEIVVDACFSLSSHYSWGGNRLDFLHECRDFLGMRKVTLKNPGATRWSSHYYVVERVAYMLPALLLALHEDTHLAVTQSIFDLRVQLGIVSMIPLLQLLQTLIKALQTDGAFISTLVDAVSEAIVELRQHYEAQNSWSGHRFAQWIAYTTCNDSDSDTDVDCGYVMSCGPDAFGATHAEEVLCYKVKDDIFPLHARHVATDANRRPGPRPQVVNAEQFKLIVSEVKSDMTLAAKSVIDDLESRFPSRDALKAFEIVCPQFWNSELDELEVDELFQEGMEKICEQFGEARETGSGSVPPIINQEKLREQAAAYKVFARDAAKQTGGDGGSVSEQRDDMRVMWQRISRGGDSAVNQIGEFMKVARLLMTIIGTSVGDERAFSAMTFVKNRLRASLEQHLELCVRVKEQSLFNQENFPYTDALTAWHEASKRCRYNV